MRICSKCKIKKEFKHFYKSKQGTHGLESRCKECTKDAKRDYYIKNKDDIIKKSIDYQKNNPEVSRKACKNWRAKNSYKQAKMTKDWSNRNRGKRNASSSKRRALKLKATPNWAELNKINKVYEKAKWLESITGIKYHVDHIIPLNNENVCGLHVWSNLQILSAELNIKKGNKND